jgi:hypothetical protein
MGYTNFTPIMAVSSANGVQRKRKWETDYRYFNVRFCYMFLYCSDM